MKCVKHFLPITALQGVIQPLFHLELELSQFLRLLQWFYFTNTKWKRGCITPCNAVIGRKCLTHFVTKSVQYAENAEKNLTGKTIRQYEPN